MADASVLITISAKDLASAVFKQIGTGAKAGLGKAAKGLEKYQKGLEKAGKAATEMGKKMSIGVTAPLAVFAGVALDSAVKAERLTQTLEGMAGGADKAASFIDAIKTASMGTIPQIEALDIANKALSFGVVETEEGMASLVETAIVLGKAQGLDAATAVGDLTTALARQSPMILDNLGITLKMSEASQIAAENAHKFGLEADGLTKAQEFQIAAMVKGQEAAAKMGGMQEDMATKVERAKSTMSDLTTTLGASLIPALDSALDIVTPVIEGFANMSPEMQKVAVGLAAVAAGAGPALAMFGTLTTAITQIPAVAARAKAAMLALNASMIGVAITIGAVVAVGKVYLEQQKKMNQATEEAVGTASTWSSEAQSMIGDGQELGNTLADMATRTNEVSDAWNSNIVTGTAIGGIFGTNAKIGKVYAETQEQVNKIAVKNSATFKEYQTAVSDYNAIVTDSAAKVEVFTEAQFNMATIMERGASAASLQADAILQQKLGVEEAAFSFEDLAASGEASEHVMAALALQTERETEVRAQAAQATMDHNEALLNSVGTIDQAATSTTRHAQGLQERNRAMDDGTGKTAANAEALVVHLSVAEKAARVADMQAASAHRQAAALEVSRQAAIAAAESQVALAGSLMDATDAQIASTLIQQLDPEALGATAYTEGVTQIQVAFGLADEKSIALASSLGPLADAMNEGIIPTESFDEALTALIADAADGEVNTGALLDQFAKAPGLIGPSEEKLTNFNERLVSTGEDAAVGEEGLVNYGAAADALTGQVDVLTSSVIELNTQLVQASTVTLPTVPAAAAAAAPAAVSTTPGFQFGGTVPGPIGGAPVLVMAEPGEQFTPLAQQRNINNSFGGNTQTVIINDSGALGFFEEQQRFDRLSKLSANL